MTAIDDGPADVWTAFLATAERSPSAVAIESPGASLTFEEAVAASRRLAAAFGEAGLGSGSVVHLALGNTLVFLPALLALRSLGVTVGLVSSRSRDSELQAVSEQMPPDASSCPRTWPPWSCTPWAGPRCRWSPWAPGTPTSSSCGSSRPSAGRPGTSPW